MTRVASSSEMQNLVGIWIYDWLMFANPDLLCDYDVAGRMLRLLSENCGLFVSLCHEKTLNVGQIRLFRQAASIEINTIR